MAAIKKPKLYCDYSTEKLFNFIRGGKDVVTTQALLQVGADINARDPEGYTPILLACLKDRVELVDLLIESGANVDVKYGKDWTLLHYASELGLIQIVRTLVNILPDLDARDIHGETALHLASRSGYLEIVQCLVEEGADIDMKSFEDFTPLLCAAQVSAKDVVDILLNTGANVEGCKEILLYYAARSGWTKLVHSLIQRVPNMNECVFGETFLHAASTIGHLDMVKCLLEEGANINKRNDGGPKSGETALHQASRKGHLELVKCFVEKGADINVINFNGATPVLLAARFSYKDVVDILLNTGANVDGCKEMLLYYAARNGWTKLVHSLVKKVPNLNKCVFGETFLHAASTIGHLDIVKCLLEKGANINKRNDGGPKSGETAFHQASREGHLELVKCFVEKGVDINVINYNGATPILLAAEYSYKDVVDMLMQYGANVDGCKEMLLYYASRSGWTKLVHSLVKRVHNLNECVLGETFLHAASAKEHLDIVKYLLEEGADINKRNNGGPKNGETALHPASRYGQLDLVKCLVEKGGDINVKNYNGATPVLLAAQHSYKDIVDLLMQHGANLDAIDEINYTVLHWASIEGWLDVVKSVVKQNYHLDARGDLDGMTALNFACCTGQFNVVQYLLQAGARWDIVDQYGSSPLTNTIQMQTYFKIIKLLIENGAYLKSVDYEFMVNSSLLKVLLQDVELCCQAIVNKFNHDLTELYKLPASRNLPCIEKMKIVSGSEVARAIKQNVIFEIQTKGHCNILEVRPMVLSIFSVRSVLKYYCEKNNPEL